MGTNCSAFNYSKSCCLPDAECKVVDGAGVSQCSCSPHCHDDDKVMCCKDIHCPPSKKIIIECAIQCIIICLYCFGIICHYMKLSVKSAKTCQDYGCCFTNLTSSGCQHATLNVSDTEQRDVNCSNKSAMCRK